MRPRGCAGGGGGGGGGGCGGGTQDGHVGGGTQDGHTGGAHGRSTWMITWEEIHGFMIWKPYAMIADLPLAELKGIQARAYAEVANGIFSRIAL